MITTLCSHLSDREIELNQWIEFADSIAITGAEKLSQSLLEYETALKWIENNHQVAISMAARLARVLDETIGLKAELISIKEEIGQTMVEFKCSFVDAWIALRQELSKQVVSVRSECKSELNDALDNLSAKHDNEKKCLESQIRSLQHYVKLEREKLAQLNDDLNAASTAISEERHKQTVLQNEFDVERQALNNELIKSNAEIDRLNNLLEDEKANKQKELAAMQKRMDHEFDEIEFKVKRSMKQLVDAKNKEIVAALKRAEEAEQVLSELKACVSPIISTAESSREK